ncbi:AMP-binding protein [Soonwooa sp.]|uniref:AMP-binding protein n=1 Tax=Soonwooa sp. TaxID=1938592 RepID=UPI00289CE560|nr:AMP-binding protein [Soonwooa sp.]
MLIDCSDIQLDIVKPKNDFETKVFEFFQECLSDKLTTSIKSSGSTGIPKLIEVEKSRMFASAKMTCDFLGLKKGNSAALCLPIEYISGKMMVIRAIERQLILNVLEPKSDALANLETEVDFCAMTPLQVEHSLDKLHLIKKLIIGGAAVSESLKKKIYDSLKTSNQEIFETYGMSETLSHVALRKIYPITEDYFTCFEGVNISISPSGCLIINAPNISNDLIVTNDLVEIIGENQFRFLGRIDNVINSGGAKIFPEEVEALIKKETPYEVVVTAILDDVLGEKMIAVVEAPPSEDLKIKISNINYRRKLDRPKDVIFIENIPRTPNGKVNRIDLKAIINRYRDE